MWLWVRLGLNTDTRWTSSVYYKASSPYPNRKAGVPAVTRPWVSACVCVCRRGHCGASAAAAAVHSGVCVPGCDDGQRGAAEGALATAWQSRLFAEEVTRNPGGTEEDTHFHKHTCVLHIKSQTETPYWTLAAKNTT